MSADDVRRAEAIRRLAQALSQPSEVEVWLSNVFYDAAHDGTEWPDGEGGWTEDEYGFDCDDLAAVIGPLLRSALADGPVAS